MANLNFSQKEQLKEVGAYLRQTRQNQGRSLDQIATAIYVRPTLLKAIEEGEAKPLPEPVFIQGFIRRYGDALELDGVTLSQKFSIDSGLTFSNAEVSETRKPQASPRSKSALTLDFVKSGLKAPLVQKMRESSSTYLSKAGLKAPLVQKIQESSSTYLSFVAVGVVAVLGLSLLANLINRPKSTAVTTEETEPKAELADSSFKTGSLTDTTNSEPPASEFANGPLSSAEDAPITVAISLTGECWIRVIVDGKTQFEGTLNEGAQKTWTAQKEIKLRAGNAGAILLSLNGASAQPVGAIDTVKVITFTPTSTPEEIAL